MLALFLGLSVFCSSVCIHTRKPLLCVILNANRKEKKRWRSDNEARAMCIILYSKCNFQNGELELLYGKCL